ncbi:MAG: hypothetical protein DRN25_01485, partial [Thermoplasmata archaeon]
LRAGFGIPDNLNYGALSLVKKTSSLYETNPLVGILLRISIPPIKYIFHIFISKEKTEKFRKTKRLISDYVSIQ